MPTAAPATAATTPEIRRPGEHERFRSGHLLAIVALADFTRHEGGPAFTSGVNEELSYQLFRTFGHKIVSHTFGAGAAPGRHAGGACVSHVLEGSVRVSGALVRTSVRLIDAGAGCIAWSEQFDRNGAFDIALQEELALAICAALLLYFEQG